MIKKSATVPFKIIPCFKGPTDLKTAPNQSVISVPNQSVVFTPRILMLYVSCICNQ